MKKQTTIISALVVIILVLVIFGGYSALKANQKTEVSSGVDTTYMKNQFINGCVSENTTYTQCACAFDNLLEKWGVDKFLENSLNYEKTNVLPEGMVAAVLECIK